MASEYDASYPVIDGACAICVKWNYEEISDTQAVIAPVIFRNDYSWDGEDTDGYFHEVLSPDSDGVSRTWYDISAARYEGDEAIKQIDSFAPRYYQRKENDYYVKLTLNWHDWYSHDQWSGSGYYEFSVKIKAAVKPSAPVKADGSDDVVELVGLKDFKLTWQKPNEDDGYNKVPSTFKNVVIKRKDNGDRWNTIKTLPGDTTTYTDKTTDQGSSYAYRVYYHNGVKLSDPLPSTSADVTMYTHPLKPAIIEAKQGTKDNTKATVRWENDNKGANYDSQTLMKSADGANFESVTIDSKLTRNLVVNIDPTKLYRFKLAVKSPLKNKDGENVTEYSNVFTMWTKPVPPTAVSHSRTSDSRNVVTWSYEGSEKNLTKFIVLRSENGNKFAQFGNAAASARTFEDDGCRPDHSYSYKVRAVNDAYENDPKKEVASETTLNTPKAPGKITGYMLDGSTVRLNIENTSFTANKTYIYVRKKNYTDWHLISQVTGKATTADVDVSAYPGPLYFKAMNLAGDLESEFSPESVEITAASQPDHPLTIEPVNGEKATWSTFMMGNQPMKTIVFRWRYVSTDGSPQEQAIVYIQYQKKSPGAVQPQTIKTTIPVNGDSNAVRWIVGDANGNMNPDIGSTVRWGVRTKSANGEWNASDDGTYELYSSHFTFCDRPQPVVSVTNTDEIGNLLSFPICVSVSDVVDLARFDLRIAKSESGTLDGAVTVFEKSGCEGDIAKIGLDEFIPETDSDYFVLVTAYDKNGFANEKEASAEFSTRANAVAMLNVNVRNDTNEGTASISISPIDGSGDAPSRIVLVRVSDHESYLLDTNGPSAVFQDLYAPINLEYTYRIMAFTDGGGFSVTEVKNIVRSPYWFFLWDGKAAKGIWDCQDPWSVKRPDKTRKNYAGRKDPVSYDTGSVEVSHKTHFWVETREDAMAFYRLMMDGGRCVYKSGEGFVFKADVELDVTPTYRIDSWYGEVECDIVKISGGDNL